MGEFLFFAPAGVFDALALGIDPGLLCLRIGEAPAFVLDALLLSLLLKRSWMGFAFDVVADDEDAARTVGIDVTSYKLTAFGIGTALAGLAGGLYIYFAHIILPDTLDFALSLAILPVVVIYVIFSRQLISGLTSGAVK